MLPQRTVIVCAVIVGLSTGLSPAQTSNTPPAGIQQPEPIAAVVNGDNIGEAELAAAVRSQLRGQSVSLEVTTQLRHLILQLLIDGRLVEQFVAEKKFLADPAKIDQTIASIKKKVEAAGTTFEDALKLQGQSEKSLRTRLFGQFAFQKYAETQVTERKQREHFQGHKSEYDGTEVHARHLLLKVDSKASPETKQKALTKIKAVRAEILGGLDFAEAAKKYSEGPSGPSGGDLGFFPRHKRMVEPFAAAAFALNGADVSEPVETQFGWHLIQVVERKPGDKKFEDVQAELKASLMQALWKQTAAQQRKKAKIRIPASSPSGTPTFGR